MGNLPVFNLENVGLFLYNNLGYNCFHFVLYITNGILGSEEIKNEK
jgi:hypothetical protein